jgi:hypothetical protein
MSMKRKWLSALFLSMMALSSFTGTAMNPKEIEDLLHIMNETKVEFTIPDDEGDKADGKRPPIDFVQSKEPHVPESLHTSANDS